MWLRSGSDTLDDDAREELLALDRALAGDPLDAEHADVAVVVACVRGDAQRMEPSFEARLDRLVRDRFAGGPAARPTATAPLAGAGAVPPARLASRPWRRPRRAVPALAGLATAGAAALVAVAILAGGGLPGSGSGGSAGVSAPGGSAGAGRLSSAGVESAPAIAMSTTTTTMSSAATTTAAAGVAAAGTAAAGAAATTTAAGGAAAAPSDAYGPAAAAPLPPFGTGRDVQRDATIALTVGRGQVQNAADRVVALADSLSAIVANSNVSSDDQGDSQANFLLLVPSGQLEAALTDLSQIGHVSSRTQDTLDITDQTTSAGDRLQEAQAERASLLRQLADASTGRAAGAIEAQLSAADGRIASDRANLASLVQQADNASVQVSITQSAPRRVAPVAKAGWTPHDALHDALRVLEVTFAVLVITLAALVPGVLVAVALWQALAVGRRRRRERALASI